MLLCVDVTHSGCCAQSCGLMWSQWEEILVLQWSSSNGFLLDSLPKWACDLPWASLFWSFCCGTLIIADKWKTLPASNGVICFSALTQKWQQRKHTLCSTEFITVKLISRILTHTDLQRCTFMHPFFYHNCIFCIVIHEYYVFIYTVISA